MNEELILKIYLDDNNEFRIQYDGENLIKADVLRLIKLLTKIKTID